MRREGVAVGINGSKDTRWDPCDHIQTPGWRSVVPDDDEDERGEMGWRGSWWWACGDVVGVVVLVGAALRASGGGGEGVLGVPEGKRCRVPAGWLGVVLGLRGVR